MDFDRFSSLFRRCSLEEGVVGRPLAHFGTLLASFWHRKSSLSTAESVKHLSTPVEDLENSHPKGASSFATPTLWPSPGRNPR